MLKKIIVIGLAFLLGVAGICATVKICDKAVIKPWTTEARYTFQAE